MKKFLALLLVVVCLFSVVACNNEGGEVDSKEEKVETNLKDAE